MTYKPGDKPSEETRKKMSLSHMGLKHTEDEKQKIRLALTGKPKSAEHNRKNGLAHKVMTPRRLEALREVSRRNIGANRSIETKNKIRMALMGKPKSPEHCAKLKLLNTGRKWSLEHKEKMSLYRTGRPIHSDEHKKGLSLKWSREKNPAWKEGISFEPYGIEFNDKLKEQIRERDHHLCQECWIWEGLHIHLTRYKLSVHHIDYNKKNNSPSNLITLCTDCHAKTNYTREDWKRHYQEVNKRWHG